jgi:hypothetical protein
MGQQEYEMNTTKMFGRGLLAVAAALLWQVPAQAQSSTALSSVSGLTFELSDLDTADGIDPTLSWTNPFANAYASAKTGSTLTVMPSGEWFHEFGTTLAPASVNDTSGFLAALQAASGGTVSSVTSSGASVQFTSPADGGSGSGSVSVISGFTLSAMSSLRLSGVFNVSVRGPASTSFQAPAGAAADFATQFSQGQAFATIGLNPVEGGTINTVASAADASVDEQNYTVSTTPGFAAAAYDESILGRRFSLVLTNDSTGALKGQFFLSAVASGQQISSVPEASSFALSAVGLLAMALAARRRQV